MLILYLGWSGGYAGVGLATGLRWTVGLLAYASPWLLLYAGVVLARSGDHRAPRALTAGLSILCSALLLAAAANSFGLFGSGRPPHAFLESYVEAHGGALGEILWLIFGTLLGHVGVDVLVVAATLAAALLITGSSLGHWASGSRRGAAAAARAARLSAQSVAQRSRAAQQRLRQQTALNDSTNALRAPRTRVSLSGGAVRLIDGARDLPEVFEAPGIPSVSVLETGLESSAGREHESVERTAVAESVATQNPTVPLGGPQVPLASGTQLTLADGAADMASEQPEAAEAARAFRAAEERPWVLPEPSFLRRMGEGEGESLANIDRVSRLLEQTLGHFGVEAHVVNTVSGPRVTRYELQLAPGTKVSRVSSLKDDLAYSLAATDIRVQAPIPGKQAVGVEVPNRNPNFVGLGDIYGQFPVNATPLAFWIGKDITGKPVLADLARMVHVLIAGTTGSGKSGCINCIISSILLRATPDMVRMILIDPKKVELSHFDGVPHLLAPVVTNMKNATYALANVVREMEQRYELMLKTDNAQNIRELNKKLRRAGEKELPYIVVVIDELADLMMTSPAEVEDAIIRLGQLGRGVGIHLVVATQRPSVDVITGLIKSNIPSRVAFAVSSQTDSRVILDTGGAESLLGDGDMLFHPMGSSRILRVQGAFVTPEEMKLITEHWRRQAAPEFRPDLLENPSDAGSESSRGGGEEDELLPDAITTVVATGAASVALLQRRLRVGYARAGRLIDIMESRGIISGYDGSKARSVLIDESELPRVLASLHGAEAPVTVAEGSASPADSADA